MADTSKRVEFFIPAPACACSGAAFLREQEKITHMETLISELEEGHPEVELVRHDMVEESSYSEGLKILASYLREAGEEEFASRVAFSLRYVLPAVAVDGELVCYGRVPDMEEVLARITAA